VFRCFASSEIEVWKLTRATGVWEQLTEDTEYSVTLTVPDGTQASAVGSVVPISPGTNFPASVDWEIRRALPLTQTLDLNEGDALPAISVEGAFDRQAMHAHQLNKWVLLAEASGAAQSELNVRAVDWTKTYDSVRLELFGVYPSTAARIRVKIDDNSTGTPVGSGLFSSWITLFGHDASVNGERTSTWATDTGILVGASLVEGVNGSLTIHSRDEKLYATGQYVYTDSVESSVCVATMGGTATGSYTHHGFYVDGSGSGTTVTGLVRLWGMPKA
jgi:hypothetical protein